MTRALAEIDTLLSAEKSLFGEPEWVEDNAVAKLASAVVDASGNVVGGLSFRAQVPIETAVQRGTAALILDGLPIQRLSYRPDNPHSNKGGHPIPAHLRWQKLPADRTRIYRWRNNRVWPMRDNLAAGEVVDPEPNAFMSALELFLEACGISAYLPEPPHRPTLELE